MRHQNDDIIREIRKRLKKEPNMPAEAFAALTAQLAELRHIGRPKAKDKPVAPSSRIAPHVCRDA